MSATSTMTTTSTSTSTTSTVANETEIEGLHIRSHHQHQSNNNNNNNSYNKRQQHRELHKQLFASANSSLPLDCRINTSRPYWWRRLRCDDPISLSPLKRLGYPPFDLPSDPGMENHIECWFDGKVLADYLVSTCNFSHPLSRRDLTQYECRTLDLYLTNHGLGLPKVEQAFLHKDDTMQHNRTTEVLTSIFAVPSRSVHHRNQNNNHNNNNNHNHQFESDIAAPSSPSSPSSNVAESRRPLRSHFPSLTETQTRTQTPSTWSRTQNSNNSSNNRNQWPSLSPASSSSHSNTPAPHVWGPKASTASPARNKPKHILLVGSRKPAQG